LNALIPGINPGVIMNPNYEREKGILQTDGAKFYKRNNSNALRRN
jgi:hypothetical protein